MSSALQLAECFGYLTPVEVRELQRIVRRLPADSVLINIGIGAATSVLAMHEARPRAKIVGIDTDEFTGEAQLQEAGLAENPLWRRLTGDSAVVGQHWAGKVDGVLVDGDHSEQGVRRDIAVWLPHLKPEGVMIFHDYDDWPAGHPRHGENPWPDVRRVVDELMAGWLEVGRAERLIALARFGDPWLEL